MRPIYIKRREFIGKSVIGLLSTDLGLPLINKTVCASQAQKQKVIFRTLGRTKIRIPVVSFGVMNSDSPDLIRKAIDMGIKLLDTAHTYLRGNSEKAIGEIVEETKSRDRVYIATKMKCALDEAKGIYLPEANAQGPGANAENFNSQLSLSLQRLRTDYVDILYLHRPPSAQMVSFQPLMGALIKAKDSGKARFIGITTHTYDPTVIRAAADAGIYDVVLTAYNFMQKNIEDMKKAIQYAASKGVGIIAMKTQGGVLLNKEKKIEVNHKAALKWALGNENICTVIPGITSFDQMDLDFSVMNNLTLSEEEEKYLRLASLVRDPLYCQNCRACIPTCPRGVEIPTLIRAYMYAEAYRNPIQTKITMDELPKECSLSVCQNCSSCSASCANGINIHERLNSLMA